MGLERGKRAVGSFGDSTPKRNANLIPESV